MFLASKSRPLALKCIGFIKASGVEAQKRDLSILEDEARRTLRSSAVRLSTRSFAVDRTTRVPENAETKVQRPYRSVLEEVLIKEDDQPKTRAQKGRLPQHFIVARDLLICLF